jgi:hypothetical protein
MPKKKRPASKPKAKPSKTKSKPRRGRAAKARKKRSSVATTRAKQTAMKVLAGAAAGAVQAMVPPLEEAAEKLSPPKKQR